MTWPSMARVASALTEADFAPGMMPFDSEAVPGRSPGRKSATKSESAGDAAAPAGRDAAEGPSLPLPPGRRPKDGFYQPNFRPGESPDLQSEVKLEYSGRTCSSQPRKSFKLKFPGSPSKPQATSRMRLPFQSSSQPPKGVDHSFSIFNPISGHRFGSSIARRMLEQLTKKPSLLKRCLPSKPEIVDHRKASPSNMMDHSRRLDSADEGYVTNLPSSPGHGFPSWSIPSPTVTKHIQPSSPGHGHRNPGATSSPVAARQLLHPPSPGHGEVSSSRFMASMLISLCCEPDDPDEQQQFDAVDEIADNFNDDSRSSSPEGKPSECSVIVIDPASQTLASREECRCTCKHRALISARVDPSTPQAYQRKTTSKSVSRNLHTDFATAGSPSHHLIKNGSPLADRKPDNACASPVISKAARASIRRSEPYHSESFAEEIFDGSKCESRGGYRSPAQGFFANSTSSSSPEESNLRHNSVYSRAKSFSPSISKDVDSATMTKPKRGVPMRITAGFLSPPRTSSRNSNYTTSNCGYGSRKAFGRWEVGETWSFEGRSDRNHQPPATTRSATTNLLSPPRKQSLQQQRAIIPSDKIRIKDRKQSSLLKSYSQPLPSKARHALRDVDTTDDSDGSEGAECSTDSGPLYNTPRAVSPPPNYASPLTVLSEDLLLKSSSLVKFKLDQRHQSALPGPTFKQILLARSHDSVRSFTPTRVLAPDQECAHLRGPDRPAPAASRFAKTLSNSSVMSKVAEWEAKVGVVTGSSAKSAPLYRLNQSLEVIST